MWLQRAAASARHALYTHPSLTCHTHTRHTHVTLTHTTRTSHNRRDAGGYLYYIPPSDNDSLVQIDLSDDAIVAQLFANQ
jgi:hypothetical protein